MISLFLQGKEGVRNMHLMEEPAFCKHPGCGKKGQTQEESITKAAALCKARLDIKRIDGESSDPKHSKKCCHVALQNNSVSGHT